ncbi:hypothetical protein K4K52_002898 [Colletotrichum sp. SAR 10_76]|nr:hypothetical protein K4K52_002898 [Colletotrichum sp. SAR 10_76]
MAHNFRGMAFNAEPSKKSTIPIPTIDSLRPDQLAWYKKLSAEWTELQDSDLKFPDGKLSVKVLREFLYHQEVSFSEGFPMPTLVFKSGDDEDPAPNLNSLMQTFPATTEFFKLEWPELNNDNVPVQMVHLVREALEKYPRDIIPLNIALATCFIWCRIKDHPTRFLEPKANAPVPLISLMAAIVYMPEYLRRHERERLSAFMHFFRFVSQEQEQFSKIYGEDNQVNSTDIREDEISILARHEFANPRKWFWLAPFSMPGSQIPVPIGTGDIDVEGGTPGLHQATLIDDIHSLGQPHQVRGSELECEFWVPREILQATHVQKRTVEGVYELRVRDSTLNGVGGVSICNPATTIGMPWKALKGTEMVPNLAWTRIGLDLQTQPPSLKRDWDDFVTPTIQRQLREEGKSRLLKMRELNLDWSAVQVKSVGHITWDGLPRDIDKPKYALPDHQSPASRTPGRIPVPHKAKQAPAKMSAEQKEMIRKFISTHLVRDRPNNRFLDQLRRFTDGVHTETDMKKVLRGIWVGIEEQLITLDQFRDQLMKKQVIDPDRVHQTFDSRVLKPLETLFGIPVAASVQERMRAIGRVEPDLIAPLDQINGVLKAHYLGSSAYEPTAIQFKAMFDLPGFTFIADYVALATHLSGNLFSGAGWDLRANMPFLESGTIPGQSS